MNRIKLIDNSTHLLGLKKDKVNYLNFQNLHTILEKNEIQVEAGLFGNKQVWANYKPVL